MDGLQVVESSRLERVAFVCLQWVSERSNKWYSRIESVKRIPRAALLAPFAKCAPGTRDADARRIVRSRSECRPSTFLLMITGKRSTRFGEIQGPVCVDGRVLPSSWGRFGRV